MTGGSDDAVGGGTGRIAAQRALAEAHAASTRLREARARALDLLGEKSSAKGSPEAADALRSLDRRMRAIETRMRETEALMRRTEANLDALPPSPGTHPADESSR